MAAAVMMKVDLRQRDEFLQALEEAQRAATANQAAVDASPKASRAHLGSIDLRHTIDRIAGTLRSYISVRLVSRLYTEAAQPRSAGEKRAPTTYRSEHDEILAELCLTPNLTVHDLKLIRRRFAMANHPDRVGPDIRDQATRRMTIANSLIDEALRGTKSLRS